MSLSLPFPDLSEADLGRLAADIAFMLQPGDVLALEGDLGAGKSTFARALLRALSGDDALDVPSPTFTLLQSYDTPRFEVAHVDLYRLNDAAEIDELGLDAVLKRGAALVEWPQRAADRLPRERLTLSLCEDGDADRRTAQLSGTPSFAKRLARFAAIRDFLARSGWQGADTQLRYLQGDASARRYARLTRADGARAILMDSPRQPDGPPIRDGLPYSRIAHLAEDVSAFVAIGNALRASGFSAPEIFAHDLDGGLLLLEDFGDAVFGAELSRGRAQEALWARGTDTLAALARNPPAATLPLPGGTHYTMPNADAGVLMIEAELLIDWYWRAVYGSPIGAMQRDAYHAAWQPVLAAVLAQPRGWLLRDFHSPNLLALDERAAPRDVGLIDYQDALIGPLAYDVVSLLQDARLDVPEATEQALLKRYISTRKASEPGFGEAAFLSTYAALGAQRNSKILGIFARLAMRDGKRQYLAHMPRIWGYLARDLKHPSLAALAAWYDEHLPPAVRARPLLI